MPLPDSDNSKIGYFGPNSHRFPDMASFPLQNIFFLPLCSTPILKMFPLHQIAEIRLHRANYSYTQFSHKT